MGRVRWWIVRAVVRATFAAVFAVSTAAALTCLAVQCSGPSACALGTAHGNASATANMAHILFIILLQHLYPKRFDMFSTEIIRLFLCDSFSEEE
jgi:hypothetical protein